MPPPSSDPAPVRPSDRGERPRLVVALSGGGARCFAQVGALGALRTRDVVPVAAAASSSSAFVAALWAAGHPEDRIHDLLARAIVAAIADVDLASGLLGHDGLRRTLEPHLPERFEELERPIAVVATDAEEGRRVVLDSGPLLPALLASNAFPGLFAPVRLDGRTLIDGGPLEMLPVRTARERWSEPVLAIDVGPSRSLGVPLVGGDGQANLPRVVRAAAASLALGWKSYVITQSELQRLQLEAHPPRWLLRPDLPDDVGILRFDLAARANETGRRSARHFLARERLGEGG